MPMAVSTRRPVPAASESVAVNAPLFRGLVDGLRDDRRAVILDLGPASPATVALLTPFRCRLDIADLADGLDALNAESDRAGLDQRIAELLPAPRQEPVDIVLCWDLLNYLHKPALTALMDVLAGRGRQGTRIHFLVAYSDSRMPARPGRWSPLADSRLVVSPVTREERDAPRYTPEDLGRCLRSFRVDGAMLLRNGMQEFVYRL